jgi:hypothetical protein
MFSKRRRQIRKTKITKRKRNTQKKGRNGRKMINSRKFRIRSNKTGGGIVNIENLGEKVNDKCPICLSPFSEIESGKTIYETKCNHLFHTECLGKWCDKHKDVNAESDVTCPVCLTHIVADCISVRFNMNGNKPYWK